MRELLEEPFFFDGPNGRLFGVLHGPASAGKGERDHAKNRDKKREPCSTGLVFCSPFAEEKLWAHRVFVSFARLLAKEGFAVLRFDYMGTGDSQGETEDATVETHLSDIRAAAHELKKRTGIQTVGLLGLRLGATLAFLAARRPPTAADFLVLWEPILKGDEYLQRCLRSHLATQMAAYRKIVKTRNQILADIEEGKPANIEGYLLSSEFCRQVRAIDLMDGDEGGLYQPVLLVAVTARPDGATGKQAEKFFLEQIKQTHAYSRFVTAKEEPFWSELKTYFETAPDLFEKTLTWLRGLTRGETCKKDEAASVPCASIHEKGCPSITRQ